MSSWKDAEQVCVHNNGHLWSVNSYSEWWNIMHSIGQSEGNAFHTQGMSLLGTNLLFIGLEKKEQVL